MEGKLLDKVEDDYMLQGVGLELGRRSMILTSETVREWSISRVFRADT